MRNPLRTRKEPRLNLRFDSHDVLDEFELAAHKNGMTLPNWIKAVMKDRLNSQDHMPDLANITAESILIIRKHIENKESDDDIATAKSYVKNFIEKIKSHAARRR